MKAQMLEAVKRKRALLEENRMDRGDLDATDDSDELAPQGDGAPDSNVDNENQTAQGQGGFDHVSKQSPANSKNMFMDTKKPLVDPDHNSDDPNMAGDGTDPQSNDLGVDVHQDPRFQGRALTRNNVKTGANMKAAERGIIGDKMKLGNSQSNVADTDLDNEVEPTPDEDNRPSNFSGFKGARQKLDGFLSKMKKA